MSNHYRCIKFLRTTNFKLTIYSHRYRLYTTKFLGNNIPTSSYCIQCNRCPSQYIVHTERISYFLNCDHNYANKSCLQPFFGYSLYPVVCSCQGYRCRLPVWNVVLEFCSTKFVFLHASHVRY